MFAQDSVKFVTFELTKDTVRSCKEYLETITKFPTQEHHRCKKCFDLLNQVAWLNTCFPLQASHIIILG